MEVKFKKLTVTDENGNLRNTQEYKHNEYEDPIWFKKVDGDGNVLVEMIYTYEYDSRGRRTLMKIEDTVNNRTTVMKYEY